MIYKVLYIPGGAGFLPSTVAPRINSSKDARRIIPFPWEHAAVGGNYFHHMRRWNTSQVAMRCGLDQNVHWGVPSMWANCWDIDPNLGILPHKIRKLLGRFDFFRGTSMSSHMIPIWRHVNRLWRYGVAMILILPSPQYPIIKNFIGGLFFISPDILVVRSGGDMTLLLKQLISSWS